MKMGIKDVCSFSDGQTDRHTHTHKSKSFRGYKDKIFIRRTKLDDRHFLTLRHTVEL